ncbi:MAG: phage/plasmid primase, P4 family [Ignavibacteria bacterium]
MTDFNISYADRITSAYTVRNLSEIVEMMRIDADLRAKTELVRAQSDKSRRGELKKTTLPHIVPARLKDGKRNAESVISNQFLIFDLDNISEPDAYKISKSVRTKPNLFLMFTSPSGWPRLKIVYKLARPLINQTDYGFVYDYYSAKFESEYGVSLDKGGRQISLGFYATSDPNLFYNPVAEVLNDLIPIIERDRKVLSEPVITDLSGLPALSEFLKGQISAGLSEYVRVLYGLASLGESGREFFHIICGDNATYRQDTQEKLGKDFDYALKHYDSTREDSIRINSLFHLARRKGFRPQFVKLTEFGLTSEMARMFGDNLKYCADLDEWLSWNGSKWEPCSYGRVVDYYKTMLLELKQRGNSIKDESFLKRYTGFLNLCETDNSLTRVSKLLKFEPNIRVELAELDHDGNLLGVQNGVIKLSDNGKILFDTSTPDDMLTKTLGCDFNPDAKCPRFNRFLAEALGDDSVIGFLQRYIGYALTSGTDAEVLVFLFGSGGTGKSLFCDVLSMLFGDYFQRTGIELLLIGRDKGSSEPAPELLKLNGARMVVPDEIPSQRTFNDSAIKNLTGSDPITSRQLYSKKYLTFTPSFKLLLYGNKQPALKSTDLGACPTIQYSANIAKTA